MYVTEEGWKVFGLEEDARATDLRHAARLGNFASGTHETEVLIIGNEVTGVDPDLLELCERIYSLPMGGEKKSFNVAIAFSIAAYALPRERVGD